MLIMTTICDDDYGDNGAATDELKLIKHSTYIQMFMSMN